MAGTRRLDELIQSIGAKSEFPDGPLLVALSGGPDSAALSVLATRISQTVRAVHVNHGTPQAPDLEEAARAIGQTLRIDVTVVEADLDGIKFTEEAARDARYHALREARGEGEWIVTGHTLDDQAETVLLNLLRGAGLAGLAGIPVTTRERVARPLLGATRGELREMAVLAALPFADDPSNLDTAHTRNRLRHEVIPLLEAEFNPQLRVALARTALAVRADDEYLQQLTAGFPVTIEEGGSAIPRSVLLTTPRALADRILRMLITNLRPPHPPMRAELARIWALVEGHAQRAELEGGIIAELSQGMVRLSRGDDTSR